MELRHHDKIDKQQCQGHHFGHLPDHLGHLGGFTGNFSGAAIWQVQCFQLGAQITGDQGGVVAFGGIAGHADLAGAVFARNGRIGVAVGAGGKLAQGMGLVHGVTVIVGGRCDELHLEQIVQVRGIGLIHNRHIIGIAAHFQGGCGGIGAELCGDLLVHLRHRQAKAHGFVLINDDMHLLVAGFLPVGDILDAVHAVQQVHHLLAGGGQAVQVLAVDVHLHAAAGQCAHIHAAGADVHFAVQVSGVIGDLLLDGLAVAGALVSQQNIIGKAGVVRGALSAGHHQHAAGAVAAAGHGAHRFHAVNVGNGVHHGVCGGKGILFFGIRRHRYRNRKLVGAHIRDEHHAHGGNAPDRYGQQHDRQCERDGLAL